jgi:CubicO group peptidase (beta-lactamase class C family)
MAGKASESRMITIRNWQESGNLRWSFQNMDKLFPVSVITAAAADDRIVPLKPRRHERFQELTVALPYGIEKNVSTLLSETNTDAWMLLQGDEILAEEYFGGMDAGRRHLLMSISKSIVSAVVGALAGRGVLDIGQTIDHYIPELSGSGYKGATVRDVLDMRSGVRFSEEYLDPESEVRQLDEAVGWAPSGLHGHRTLKSFLTTLKQDRDHGGYFEYRSCETDVLGWLCEAVSGRSFAELASELLWTPLGAGYDAFITMDAVGTGMFDGGISATLRDTALFGAMIRDRGRALDGAQVLDSGWVDDIFRGGPDSSQAFASGPHGDTMYGGQYRSQFWFITDNRDEAYCLGIHGQMIYINRKTGIVGVKFSSTTLPVDPFAGPAAAAMFGAISDTFL